VWAWVVRRVGMRALPAVTTSGPRAPARPAVPARAQPDDSQRGAPSGVGVGDAPSHLPPPPPLSTPQTSDCTSGYYWDVGTSRCLECGYNQWCAGAKSTPTSASRTGCGNNKNTTTTLAKSDRECRECPG
jgi:hypothetical protein